MNEKHWITTVSEADNSLDVSISRARFRFVIFKGGETIIEVLEPREWRPWVIRDLRSKQKFLAVTYSEVAKFVLAISSGKTPPDGAPFDEQFPAEHQHAIQERWETEERHKWNFPKRLQGVH